MSHNTFGKIFRFTTFGESHGPALGVVIDGVPPGLELDAGDIQRELDRRRPGQSAVSTPRTEQDKAEILSGVFEGKTTGAPVAVLMRNRDQKPEAYDNIREAFRPGHADYTYWCKYGHYDHRGGGRSSGRETACRVMAGAVAKKLLGKFSIRVTAGTVEAGGVAARTWDESQIEKNPVRCPDAQAAPEMERAILAAKEKGDSVGGIVECRVTGCPAGLGEPVYGKLNAELAGAMMSIGASRGVEFGLGRESARLSGSQNNDPMGPDGFESNRCGGILGGISTGETIVLRVFFKPTSSVSVEQNTVDREGRAAKICVQGRHDPCIVPRAAVVVEAMAAVVLADHLMRDRATGILEDSEQD